jgi:hypothetical protein
VSPVFARVVLGGLLLAGGALSSPARADVAVPEGARRLDGIAAVVGGLAPGAQVISIYRSDVELRARLALLHQAAFVPSRAEEPRVSTREALAELPDALLRASLAELVGEALIAVEAARLNLERPSARELAEERARLLGARGDPASVRELLAALGVGERELAEWIARRAVVNGFLQANLEGTLEVSNDELARTFASEPHPFQGHPLDEVRERFSAWLTQQRTQQAVERWVESLAQRTPHRVLVPY